MEHEPLIAAARRRARLLQRRDARPYQTHLDEVARTTGADDWSDFIANPRPLPVSAKPDQDAEDEADPMLAWCMLGFACGFAVMLASTCLPIEWGDGITHTILAGLTIMTASMMPLLWDMIRREYIEPARSGTPTPKRDARTRARCSAQGWMSLSAIVLTGLAMGSMAIQNHIPAERIAKVVTDRSTTPKVSVPWSDEPDPLVATSMSGGVSRFRMVVGDGRLGWISYRSRIRIPTYAGGEAMARSYQDHPVLRMVGEVRCRTREWRIIGFESSDSYGSAAAMVHRMQGAWKKPLSEETGERLCPGYRRMTA